jgi:O-acetyl-ADP-ribose deacetylase (regulator of RNase III)
MPLIHYQKRDIFDATTQVIVNTVNCKGVMGKGLAFIQTEISRYVPGVSTGV